MRIKGSAALVTGGASGLGAATTRALTDAGATVWAVDLPSAVAAADEQPGVHYLAADVTAPDQVRAAFAEVTATGLPLRSVVSCAGIAPAARIVGRSAAHDPDLYARVVSVNLLGTLYVMTAAAEAMVAVEPDDSGQRGVIINTGSIAAYDGQVGQAAYAASKGGVVAATLPAARDLAQYGIRVLAIAPGLMETPMLAGVHEEARATASAGVPFPQRLGAPADYASLVLAILGQDYLNGEVVRLDGALRLPPR